MDMFGSSDEESEAPKHLSDASLNDAMSDALCNVVFTVLMKTKPKVPVVAAHDSSFVLESEIAIISQVVPVEGRICAPQEEVVGLVAKLGIGKVRNIGTFAIEEFLRSPTRKFDIIVCLFELLSEEEAHRIGAALMPNGTILAFGSPAGRSVFSPSIWTTESIKTHTPVELSANIIYGSGIHGNVASNVALQEVRKRAVRINHAGALYWPGLRSPAHLAQERVNINAISVCLTAQEAALGIFSAASHARAAQILQEHGVCVFPEMRTAEEVQAWSAAGRADMSVAIQRLRVQHQVDLLASAEDVSMDNVVKDNFHELSMREAYRCDLRNSPQMTQMHAHLPKQLTKLGRAVEKESGGQGLTLAVADGKASSASHGAYASAASRKATLTATAAATTPAVATAAADSNIVPTMASKIAAAYERCLASRTVPSMTPGTSATATALARGHESAPELRYHRGLVGVLTEIMNPLASSGRSKLPDDVDIEHGNWGKWNFSGPGPGSFTPPCIGKMGVVVSLPGCKDQTIHADTAHIYEHVHLPPHYLNFFMPCASSEAISTAVLKASSASTLAATATAAAAVAAKAAAKMEGEEGEEDEEEVFIDEEAALRELVAEAEAKAQHDQEHEQQKQESSVAPSTPAECFFQGQTAFVIGSHRMGVAATVMTHPDAQSFLESRLVRPHLATGDGLIFDCRILHFGLSNWSHLKKEPTTERDWRMMMYVNYHQQWFLDPKNWNDNAKLF